jgi:hypothetical protein
MLDSIVILTKTYGRTSQLLVVDFFVGGEIMAYIG